jgi:hypothetical protein
MSAIKIQEFFYFIFRDDEIPERYSSGQDRNIRPVNLYINFKLDRLNTRRDYLEVFKRMGTERGYKHNRTEYFDDLTKSKFVLSPRGLGRIVFIIISAKELQGTINCNCN